jgi:hypothetical protein
MLMIIKFFTTGGIFWKSDLALKLMTISFIEFLKEFALMIFVITIYYPYMFTRKTIPIAFRRLLP